MKKIFFLFACIFAVLTGFYFVSCSSDDDEQSSSPLIGTWEVGYNSSGIDNIYVMFCADGTGYSITKNNEEGIYYYGTQYRASGFDYTYNEETGQLTIMDGKRAKTVYVVMLNNSKLVLKESVNSTNIKNFAKVSAPLSIAQIKEVLTSKGSEGASPFYAFYF